GREQLLIVEPLIALPRLDQRTDEVVTWRGLLGRHQVLEHADDSVGRLLGLCKLCRCRRRDEQPGELATQAGPVCLWHAEEFADHCEREWERKRRDKVDTLLGTQRRDVIEQ